MARQSDLEYVVERVGESYELWLEGPLGDRVWVVGSGETKAEMYRNALVTLNELSSLLKAQARDDSREEG